MISCFGLAPPERVFALQGGDWLDGVGAANGFHAGFGEAEVLDFALLDEFLHGSGDVFDGDVGIDAVLVEEIDGIDLEALERGFGDLADASGRLFSALGAAGCHRR